MHSVAILALAASAAASTWSGMPIPDCGWTTTLIYEADHTDTVPIPVASAMCSSMVTMPAPPPPAPVTTSMSMVTPPPYPMTSSMSSVIMCTEYSDGQPQCSAVPVPPPAPVCTQISDGQLQCPPMSTGMMPTGMMPTGGMPMPTGTGMMYPSSSVMPAIGAAATNGPIAGLVAAAGFAVAFF